MTEEMVTGLQAEAGTTTLPRCIYLEIASGNGSVSSCVYVFFLVFPAGKKTEIYFFQGLIFQGEKTKKIIHLFFDWQIELS